MTWTGRDRPVRTVVRTRIGARGGQRVTEVVRLVREGYGDWILMVFSGCPAVFSLSINHGTSGSVVSTGSRDS